MGELKFENVSVTFGHGRRKVTAVDQVSLIVPEGKVLGLVGESGSGKSTLARATVGLAPLSAGAVLLDGVPLDHGRLRQPIQMVFQDPYSSLDPRMSVRDSVAQAIPKSVARGRAARRQIATEMLAKVGIDSARSAAKPSTFSGGQRQRIALARALAARPKAIIADEITSALDVSVQGAVLNLLRELHDELAFSMLFISHNLAVVRYVSDYIAVIYLGQIVEIGTAADVISNPQHEYTRELLAAAPDMDSGLLDESR